MENTIRRSLADTVWEIREHKLVHELEDGEVGDEFKYDI